ncbi:phage tail protein [Cronobacter muytjensii]|jgi:phage-related tail fiber protein|uniref:phage tail protein n=1 Tax=Cronobacter TaxID=413496 RepID=UPI000CFBFAD8|nr:MULTISPECIES: phage tail protein [Cronobacter]ELY5873474.1 phage tail protein [Cronobacter sakazakii]MDI6454714.1 phage tail protein [Cronobacter muytjensii]
MTAKYFALLTNQGAARLANAAALGTKLNLTQLAVGDGGGSLPVPDATQTRLINEKRRAPLNMLSVDPVNTSQIIAEQIIPESEGGYWIREIGLYDDAGVLIAVANCPETYKPQLQEGSGRTQTIRLVLVVSATDAVALKIDPSVVLATRKYVDDKAIEVKLYIDQLMEQHVKAADPHTQYAPKASPALTGKPTAPTPAQSSNDTQLATTAFVQAGLAPKAPLASPALTGTPTAPTPAQTVNNTQIATTAFVKAAIAALVASSPAALDTLSELAAALGNDANFAATMTKALAGKQPLDGTLTDLSGKDAAAIISYLGLGSAAKLNVGNAAGQIPDMSFFLSGQNWFKLPGGIIVQAFSSFVYSTDSDGTAITFPVSFPDTVMGLSVLWSDSSPTAAPTFKYNAKLSDKSKALVKVTNGTGSFGCLFIAVGR